MKRKRTRKLVSTVALNGLMAFLAILWLVPVFWLIISSFRAEQGAYMPYLWPKGFTFDNYIRLFTDRKLFDFPRWFGNTMLVVLCSCAITTVLTLMVAYVYSRLRFPSRKFLMRASLVLGMFPGFMSMIAIYHFMKAVNLDQTLLALILVYSGGAALNYYIAKGYFDTIPKSLDEAAILDGASNHTVFWKIILPNAKPVIATTAINAFINPIVDYKGYRAMALIMGQEDDALSRSRLAGIQQAMAEEELTVEIVCNQSPYALDDEVLDHLLTEHPRPEVLLCSNNHLALHCLQHIRRLGLKIPQDIALLTFDNYPFSMLTDPAITAVEVDMHDMGINAARFVLQRIRKPNLQTQSFCTSPCILEREST